MSCPRLYAVIYMATGVAIAIGIPVGMVIFIEEPWAVPVAVVAIYFMASISMAELSLATQGDKNSMPLGPSFLAGFGLLNYAMLIRPILTIPGLAYLYVLPFDERGYVDKGKWLSFDMDKIKPPHHD